MLALTSLLFATNTVHAWSRSAYLYSAAFAGLTVSSFALHTSDKSHLHKNPWFWIDQLMLVAVFATGFWYMLHGSTGAQTVAVITCALVFALYYGGYLTDSCCFDQCTESATFAHACMHAVGSIGHHCVMADL
jgi:hypothetical protein